MTLQEKTGYNQDSINKLYRKFIDSLSSSDFLVTLIAWANLDNLLDALDTIEEIRLDLHE